MLFLRNLHKSICKIQVGYNLTASIEKIIKKFIISVDIKEATPIIFSSKNKVKKHNINNDNEFKKI